MVLGPCHSQQVPTSRVSKVSFEIQEEAGPPSPGQLKGPNKEAGEHLRVRSLALKSRKRQAHPALGQLKGPSKEAGEHLGAGGGKAAAELRHHLPYLSLHRYISLATL